MWICSVVSSLQDGCVIGSFNSSSTFWLFVFTQLETWRTAVHVNNSWCTPCACKCLLVLYAVCLILACTPFHSLPINFNSSLFIVLFGSSPSFYNATMRTVSCRWHADSSNPPLIQLYSISLNRQANSAEALLDVCSNETSNTLLSEESTFCGRTIHSMKMKPNRKFKKCVFYLLR